MTNEKMEADALRREVARLQDAKRRALEIADERAKENVALHAELERLRGAEEKHAPGRLAEPAQPARSAKADAKSVKRSRSTKLAKRSKPGAKRRGRPVTTGKGLQVNLRCHREFLTRVDKWRGRKLSRPQAIRELAEIGLKAKGG